MAKRMAIGRSEEEIAELLAGYERSGVTRREYCQRHGVPMTTFDYYRRSRSKSAKPTLARVRMEPAAASQSLLTVVCATGRRSEVPSQFSEEGLCRLLRVAERA